MLKYSADWACAMFLTDNLNYKKIPFKSFVTGLTTVVFVFDDVDAERVKEICKGLAEKMED